MRLEGKHIAVLLGRGFEDLEFWVPVMRLREEGGAVTVVGPEADQTVGGKHCLTATSDVAADAVSADDFDAIVVPGGWAPDRIRRYEAITDLVRSMYERDKIEAEQVEGRTLTSYPSVRKDLENAGATWFDEAAFRDGNIVWGRVVEDIPAFCRELVQAIADV